MTGTDSMMQAARRALTLLVTIALAFTGILGTPRPASAAVTDVTITELSDIVDGKTCTLRMAVYSAMLTNDGKTYSGCVKGVKTIYLLDGATYTLSVPRSTNTEDTSPLKGDLDIKTGLSIIGKGSGATITTNWNKDEVLDPGEFNDRIFHIQTSSLVTLANLTITGARLEKYVEMVDGIAVIVASTGGAIYNGINGKLTLSKVNVYHNGFYSVDGDGVDRLGGGIFNYDDSTLTMYDSTIEDNFAYMGGGIYNAGTLTMRNSLVHNNYAEYGGGVFSLPVIGSNSTVIVNSSISANTAETTRDGNGAGVYVGTFSTLDLTHVTIANNGNETGQKVALWMVTQAIVKMRATLLVDNPIPCGSNDPGGALHEIISYGSNLVDATGRCNFVNSTAFDDTENASITGITLLPLDYYSGPTKVYALAPGSFAINGVPLANCVQLTDQRGFSRFTKSDSTANTACDIGAFEDDSIQAFLGAYLPFVMR